MLAYGRSEGCLEGREIEEKPEPLSPGDEDVVRVEYWEDWEKTTLRRPWENTMAKMRLEWRRHLGWLEICARVVMLWVGVEVELEATG